MTYHMKNVLCGTECVERSDKMLFPYKLFEAANDRRKIISWTKDGTAITVDEQRFEKQVMIQYPGLVQVSSFLNLRRQLRVYNFDWVQTDGVYTFSHSHFIRGRSDLLEKLVYERQDSRRLGRPRKKILRRNKISTKSQTSLGSKDHAVAQQSNKRSKRKSKESLGMRNIGDGGGDGHIKHNLKGEHDLPECKETNLSPGGDLPSLRHGEHEVPKVHKLPFGRPMFDAFTHSWGRFYPQSADMEAPLGAHDAICGWYVPHSIDSHLITPYCHCKPYIHSQQDFLPPCFNLTRSDLSPGAGHNSRLRCHVGDFHSSKLQSSMYINLPSCSAQIHFHEDLRRVENYDMHEDTSCTRRPNHSFENI